MTIDLDAAIRRRKPERRRRQLVSRPDHQITWATDLPGVGAITLVADTNLYIHDAAGRLPAVVESLLDRAILFHCSVCIGEIATGIGHADPAHAGWSPEGRFACY